MDVGCVQRDEHGIEIEPPHGLEQDCRVVVTGQAQKPHALLIARLQKGLERALGAEDLVEVAVGSQVVQLPKVQVVGPQPLERVIKQSQ